MGWFDFFKKQRLCFGEQFVSLKMTKHCCEMVALPVLFGLRLLSIEIFVKQFFLGSPCDS